MSQPFYFVRCDGSGHARVPVFMRLGHTSEQLLAIVSVHGSRAGPLDREAATHHEPTDLIQVPHVRLALWNGEHAYGFVVSIDGRRADNRDGNWSFDNPDWTAYLRRESDACDVTFSIPRQLTEGTAELRINAVYSDPSNGEESCLSPTFDLGTDPDRIPDFRFGDRSVSRFRRLILD